MARSDLPLTQGVGTDVQRWIQALLIVAVVQGTSGEELTGNEKKVLFTRCAPMALTVERLSKPASDIGLTRQTIVNAAESRLRSARLFSDESTQFLYVGVIVTKSAFSVTVELARHIADAGYGLPGGITVWSTLKSGSHGGNAQYILGLISTDLDEFLTKYLRANEGHCQ